MAGRNRLTDKRYLALGGGLLAVVLLAVILVVFTNNSATPTPQPTPTPKADALTLKTDSVLLDLIAAYRLGGSAQAEQFARDRGILTKDDRVRLTLVLDTQDTASTKAKLEELGATVESSYENLLTVSAPLSLVMEKSKDLSKPGFFDSMALLEHIVDIRVPAKPEPDEAPPASQGVSVTNADAWHAAGITGKGVKVGILDGGFYGYQSLLGTGLPQRVTVKAFTSDGDIAPEGADHGTACAEIVHEMAPDAEIYLAAWETDVDWFAAVDWFVSQGVRVISQSMGDFAAPFDGTGARAKKIEELRAKGVVWVNSNGNYAEEHYAATLKPDAEGWHQFATGKNRMGVAPYGTAGFYLNWQDWKNKTIDYDLYLFNAQGDVLASSRNVQGGGKEPFEGLRYKGASGTKYYIGVKAKDPSKTVPFDFYLIHGDVEFPVARGSINTYSSSRGALAVGAIHWKTGKLESYSSQGPTWDGRPKPDISAPSVVGTLVQAYKSSGFNGTSAAAPHVAGAVALLLSYSSSLTPDQIVQALQQGAIDLGSVGVTVKDSRFGYGLLYLGTPPSR